MKFTKPAAAAAAAAAPAPQPQPVVNAPVVVLGSRCGGCGLFRSKLDPNNPFDGFCHAFPPRPIPTGFRWAKTASNELGCSFFKKRG